MIFDSIEISNFKGLRRASFTPRNFSCLVGENNAGKSSILQAIVYALNRPQYLPESMFYDAEVPIEFHCCFSIVTEAHLQRLAEEHLRKIQPLVENEVFRVVVRYRLGEKVEIKVVKNVPVEERLRDENINEAFKGKRGAGIRAVVEELYPEWLEDFPRGVNLTEAKEYIKERVSQLPSEHFQPGEVDLPSGISSSITSLLPEPIYIPAVKNVNDDLKTTQSTSFGRLLGLLLEDMSVDFDNFTAALENLKRLLNRHEVGGAEVDERHEKVRELESLVEGFLGENFPRARVVLEIPPPELKTILNSAQIYIDDGSLDLIEHKGDGIKRSLTFALLRTYVHQHDERAQQGEGEREIPRRPMLFLFEEPELYLHPKAQRVLFDTLERISQEHQVVLTTHSPLFFAPGVTANFVRVSKNDIRPKPVGVLNPVDFELDPAQVETFKLAKFENADAGFFCSKVVLFEGESDDFFMRHASRMLNAEWDFDRENIALIRVGGKGNFSRFRKFFESFGIKVQIVSDLDVVFDGYRHLGASVESNQLRDGFLVELDRRINDLNIRPEIKAKRIKSKVTQDSWRDRYERARNALRNFQATNEITEEEIGHIDELFSWEQSDARVKAIEDDQHSRDLIVPLLDNLRREGISVLVKGAIEDYYPEGAPRSGPKPERALRAIDLITTTEIARGLSAPLVAERATELEEIFNMIFAA